MKTILIGFIGLLMLFSFSFSIAENETLGVLNETPVLISAQTINDSANDSEANGNFFWKQMNIWFTFNQGKKAEKELRLAELQLVRARIAERNNDTQAMEKALDSHQKLINRVKNRVSRFDINSTNITTKLVGLERAIEVHQLRISRLNDKLNSSNLTAEEIARIQARIDQAENNTQHLMDVAKDKRDRIEQRVMNRSEEKSREREMNRIRNDSENDEISETVLSGSNESGNASS